MTDQDKIKDHSTTVIGFAGLLLGLLVNALTTIDFKEFNNTQFNNIPYTGTYLNQFTTAIFIKFLFLVATSCLLISIVNGLSTNSEIIHPTKTKTNQTINDPEKILEISVKWLCYGLAAITFIIALMITKSLSIAMVYIIVTVILMFTDYFKIYKKNVDKLSPKKNK